MYLWAPAPLSAPSQVLTPGDGCVASGRLVSRASLAAFVFHGFLVYPKGQPGSKMNTSNSESGPRAGPRKGESRTPVDTTAGVCPTYYGGGKNCFGAELPAQSCNTDNTRAKTDIDLPNERKLIGLEESRPGSPAPWASAQSEGEGSSSVDAEETNSRGSSASRRELRVALSRCNTPVLRRSPRLFESDSGSCTSMVTVGDEEEVEVERSRSRSPPSRFWRKRSRTPTGKERSPETAPKKRGRPITTGEFAGLAKAKAELNAQRERELELQAEAELAAEMAEKNRVLRTRARAAMPGGSGAAAPEELSAEALAGTVEAALEVIASIAKKSSKMKCQHVASVRKAVAVIGEAVTGLRARTESQEVAHLQAELAAMRAEVEEMKRQAAAPPTMTRDEIMFLVDARIAGIGDRLLPEPRLRPPLAADARNAACAARASVQPEEEPPAPVPSLSPPRSEPTPNPAPAASYAAATVRGKGKGKGKGKGQAERAPPAPATKPPSAPAQGPAKGKSSATREAEVARKTKRTPPAPVEEEGWTLVARKPKASASSPFRGAGLSGSWAKLACLPRPGQAEDGTPRGFSG